MSAEGEPRLELVEHFDELRVGQSVWLKHPCCGKLGGRYILVRFRASTKLVDENLRVWDSKNFMFAPKHTCKVAFYPGGELPFGTLPANTFHVEGSVITPQEVDAREVFVEVIDLGRSDAQSTSAPRKLEKIR